MTKYFIIFLLFTGTLYGQRNGSVMTSYYNSKSITKSVGLTLPENSPPSIQITSPSDGDTLTIDTSFTASVTATDSDGTIDSVVFFINDTRQAVDVSSPYTYNLPTGSVINRELKAIAYDNDLGTDADSITYYINDTNIIDYDTIYIDWTGFANLGADPNNDPSFNMYWNRVDLKKPNSSPPDTLLTYVYSSAQNDTLGPLIRTSDSSNFTTWFNDASSNIYSGWPIIISLRGVRTNDTLSFSLAGFEPNQQITFRIFGGSQSGATSEIITIGDSVNLVTGLYQQASNELLLAYGTADASGNLSFSICCPQPSNQNAYWKGMEIITGFSP